MIAFFAIECRDLMWQPRLIYLLWNHLIVHFINCKRDETKKELNGESHHEKKSEGSQKTEMYARRQAKF